MRNEYPKCYKSFYYVSSEIGRAGSHKENITTMLYGEKCLILC